MKWLAKSTAKPTVHRLTKKTTPATSVKKPTSDSLFGKIEAKAPTNTVKSSRVKYYIQAGSFAAMPNKKYLSNIKALGLEYTVRHTDRYKVLIGAYDNEKSARSALKKVREHINIGAFIVKL